jgi:streptogrisin C
MTAYAAGFNSELKQSSRVGRTALGAIAAVVALTFAIGVVPTPNTSKQAMPALVNPQVAALMTDYGLSNRDAAERIARQDSIADLATYLATKFPAAYGGLWIDHEHGGVVVAAVTRAGIGVDTARDFGLGGVVREAIVDRSVRDLRRISSEIHRMVGGAFRRAKPLGTSIDVKRNSVSVQIGATASASPATKQHRLVGKIKRIYGPAVVIVQGQRIRAHDDACRDVNCPPPLRGGVQIKGSIACSIGFVATTSSGAPAVTTAGHCPPSDSNLYTHSYRGTIIGPTLAMQDSGDVDARSISVDNVAYWNPANWLLHQGFGDFPLNETLAITSRAVKTDIVLGSYLCRTGFKTNTQCGEVNNLNGRRTGNQNLFGISACAASGDSGGPVYDYSSGRAYGQHMASTATGCSPTETSFFSPIDSIEAALGITVRTE